MKNQQEQDALAQERESIRQTIMASLRLIVQSQMVLADLQENQKRLEQLLALLDSDPEETGE
jgi:hypothetical protein